MTGEPVTATAFSVGGLETSTTHQDVESGAGVNDYGELAAELPAAQAVEMTDLGGAGAAGERDEMGRERRNPHLPQRIEDLPLPAVRTLLSLVLSKCKVYHAIRSCVSRAP